ncbi:zinc ABC transporter permease subunit ZnuB [Vibrio cyclitrophicus]|jgi:zinc transport system permease protein|uniref:High-affinity zinc uptake system membrane protein ZnuB n=3 Tax=Vibrio cyclitrophicus TaxID=47951 RepID=A0A7Z1ML88_9VIBR|nr:MULTISPECIES: zinc ABC transporter permease subunit ZnuB [Vibrio]KNH14311.1 membrane protein [Vibrio lentus]MBY7662671.1 zinc ABC transporter permease subunit ZnuB [Vibrio atlanticus]ERM60227.1 Zinc ABC transporter, inner membrane permease protein ZnuB [Vibrio cyclitrophicus FF75]KAA8602150.1 Zinc ABC transporter permease protein ZnuB [Vibrio cyclitrophicus]MBU2931552.1 zinc ABC transporter permease subunit ZnuB [Vibrio cyclitrophicus]|tara:strand:- start:209 stop:994 length:786 start_codon:yes stop_codon:yes gene_type:complete
MLEFLLPSILAGLGIALIAGPLGSFVVWRKMAYFGDTLAHASLMGLALGFLFNINLYFALLICCLMLAVLLVTLQKQKLVATDTLLGILAHSALSLGLVAVSFLDNVRIDLMSYLFGDLLAVSPTDLVFIYAGAAVIGLVLAIFWRPLLSTTVNEDLAAVDGINIDLMRLILMLLVGIVIAVGMKFVGALIMTSLLIIPAATARKFSNTPEQMAFLASIIGSISVFGGLSLSWFYDTPAGPSVVISAAAMFMLSQMVKTRA